MVHFPLPRLITGGSCFGLLYRYLRQKRYPEIAALAQSHGTKMLYRGPISHHFRPWPKDALIILGFLYCITMFTQLFWTSISVVHGFYSFVLTVTPWFLQQTPSKRPRLYSLGETVVEGGIEAIGRGALVLQEDEVLRLVVIPGHRSHGDWYRTIWCPQFLS